MKADKATAEHYTWGHGYDGWRLVDGPELSVILERMPPGASEERHYHGSARQFFFVLKGSATIEAGYETVVLGPQEGLEVAPGLAHRIFNRSHEDLEFVVYSNPSTRGDRHLSEP
ncbi:MAG TPA: cupin domain-containing protein [bacterium]|jgi:mannose-6-phosphate isomerase-like protein (cupin superfamily)|nr:cupin domain-containing protein [bacterium]